MCFRRQTNRAGGRPRLEYCRGLTPDPDTLTSYDDDSVQPRSVGFDPIWVELAFHFARRFAPAPEGIEDLAQEALLRLVSQLSSIANPVPWLYVVIRRLALRRRRELARFHAEPPVQVVDPWPAVDLRLDAEKLAAQLPPRARRALALAFAGWSEAELAVRFDCSVKGIEKSLHTARRKLRARRSESST